MLATAPPRHDASTGSLRLGPRGLALLRANASLDDVGSLALVTGHIRAFGDAQFQPLVQASWARLGFEASTPVALHTWDAAGSEPSWWQLHTEHAAMHVQAPLVSVERALRNSSLAAQFLVYAVEDQRVAPVRTAHALLAARSCANERELDGMYSMYTSLAAQAYALRRVVALAEEFGRLAPGRISPSTLVLKTRPDVILEPRQHGVSFVRSVEAKLRASGGRDPLQIWTCKGWHKLGVSDVAFVTTYEGLTLLANAYQCCLPRLLESGRLACGLAPMPEVVLRVFVDALGFRVHNGAFNLRWCRRPEACFEASEPANDEMADRLPAFHSAVDAARECVRTARADCTL